MWPFFPKCSFKNLYKIKDLLHNFRHKACKLENGEILLNQLIRKWVGRIENIHNIAGFLKIVFKQKFACSPCSMAMHIQYLLGTHHSSW